MKAYVIMGFSGDFKYGWKPILDCYGTLRMFVPDDLIIIVNNFPHPIHPYPHADKNLRYIVAEENLWELGQIQTAYKMNPDVDAFFFVHDTLHFINKPPDFTDDIYFWENEFRNLAPSIDVIIDWCKAYFPDLADKCNRKENRVCHGLMGYYTRDLLTKLMDMGLSKVRVTNKQEAVASEGLMGLLLKTVKPDIKCYNDEGYCHQKGYKNASKKYEFMVKEAKGRITHVGNSCYSEQHVFHCQVGSIAHPSYPYLFSHDNVSYLSLQDALEKNKEENYHSIFMNFYTQNRDALLQITEKRYFSFNVEGNPNNINALLFKHNHDMFILKHYGHFFPTEC